MRVRFTRRAQRDLAEIYDHISRESPTIGRVSSLVSSSASEKSAIIQWPDVQQMSLTRASLWRRGCVI